MLTPSIIAIVVGILFVAALTRATIGFGDSLLAMPLLVLLVGAKTAVPIVALCASLIGISILLKRWRQVRVQAVWRLIIGSLVGIPVGLWLLKAVPESTTKLVLGALLVLVGVNHFVRKRQQALAQAEAQALAQAEAQAEVQAEAREAQAEVQVAPSPSQERLAWVAGFVAGMLGGAYNLNGPPVVLYATLCRWPSEQFVATMQGYFLPTGLMIVLGHGLAGLWTPQVLQLTGWAVPCVLLGIVSGTWLHQRIKPGAFDSLVYGFLIVMGVVMLVMR